MGKWYLCGDIHGKYTGIWNFVHRHGEDSFDGTDKIIILGDAGFNFYLNDPKYRSGRADEYFKKKMSSFPFTYYVVRGNHEERPSVVADVWGDKWEMIYDEEVDGNVWVEKKFPNIRYFLDSPAVYRIADRNALVMGGAYSVDKYYRLMNGWSWFEQEQMTEDEMNQARQLCEDHQWNIDLVFTHTCPIMYEPTDLFLDFIDQSSVDKTMERFFGEIEYKLDYAAWCWGHFHAFRDYPRPDGRRHLMLGVDDIVELEAFMTTDVVEKV